MDNTKAVIAFFEQNEWEYREDEGAFESGVSLEGDVEGALLQIDANNGGIVVLCGLDYDIQTEAFAVLFEFCNLVNMLLPTGAVFLDTTEQIIVTRLGQYYGEGKASGDDVGEQVAFCIDLVERISSVLSSVINGEVSPADATELILRPQA